MVTVLRNMLPAGFMYVNNSFDAFWALTEYAVAICLWVSHGRGIIKIKYLAEYFRTILPLWLSGFPCVYKTFGPRYKHMSLFPCMLRCLRDAFQGFWWHYERCFLSLGRDEGNSVPLSEDYEEGTFIGMIFLQQVSKAPVTHSQTTFHTPGKYLDTSSKTVHTFSLTNNRRFLFLFFFLSCFSSLECKMLYLSI